MCIQITDSTSEIIFTDKRDLYDGWVWDVDISKLTEAIGNFNRHSIGESLADIAGFMREEK